MTSYGYFRKASSYLRPYPGLAAASVFATLLFVGAGLLAPWPMKILVDSVLGNEPLPRVHQEQPSARSA